MERHNDRFVSPGFAARCQALLGRGDRTLEGGDDEVGPALDPLLDLLSFENAVLFQKTPSEP
jgi:hypothetical protein